VISGFRVVGELGRGAFAHVFLAEQVGLANRQVAIKVSQPVGEEPQMLARLQHTNIVPIHSVHDDPIWGLRVLCMPYLGGANLAQVLEASGARLPDEVTGRSFVAALDLVARRMSAVVGVSQLRSARARASRSRSPIAITPGYGAATRGIASATRVRSVFAKYWARLPWWSRLPGQMDERVDDAELPEPARRYLRSATYIQAAVWIVAQLADALDHAHVRGLLHRDIKPTNILIAADGTPMLLDFNLSADTPDCASEHGARAMLGGTLPYMAPEHLDAFNPACATRAEAVNERSDIYSLGLILFEIIAGGHPFADPPENCELSAALTTMAAERRCGAPSLRAAFAHVPWCLDSIVARCLEPDPNGRYASAAQLATDLRCFLKDRPPKHAPCPSVRERLRMWARRNPRMTSASSVAMVAATLIVCLGGMLSLASTHLRTASARLHRAAFQTAFDEAQLLLNTTSGPSEHLSAGLARAENAIEVYGVGRKVDWVSGELVAPLPARDRETLTEEMAELVLLVARVRVYLAERSADEVERERALRSAVAWLDLAERFDVHPTSALFDDRARYHVALGNLAEAAGDRRRRDELAPRTSRDFYLLGAGALAQRRFEPAEAALLRAVTLDPRRFWAWFTLGLCHAEQGRYLEASGDFSVCTALVPNFAWPHVNRGLALARAGRLADARAAYDRALEANPQFAEAHFNRGLVCLELGDARAALADLEGARALGRRGTAVSAAIAEAKGRLGLRAEARKELDQLLAVHPTDATLLVARGFFLLADVATQSVAEQDFHRALAIDPTAARAHLGLGYLLRTSNLQRALEESTAALGIDPNLLDAVELRALLRARLGQPSATDDVDRLLQFPTARRYYNAACALAVLAEKTDEAGQASRAVMVLERAVNAGFPADAIAADPDLAALRHRKEFADLIRKRP
jgi:serine/threonine protein kinase/tetratricopeptide (TPR) repeat protein